jgi:hypothetical protein
VCAIQRNSRTQEIRESVKLKISKTYKLHHTKSTILSKPSKTTANNKIHGEKAIETSPYLERGAPKQLNIEHNV